MSARIPEQSGGEQAGPGVDGGAAGGLGVDEAQRLLNRISMAALVLAPLTAEPGNDGKSTGALMDDLDQLVHDIQRSVFPGTAVPAEPVQRVKAALRQACNRLNDEWATRPAAACDKVAADRIAEAARLLRAAVLELQNNDPSPTRQHEPVAAADVSGPMPYRAAGSAAWMDQCPIPPPPQRGDNACHRA